MEREQFNTLSSCMADVTTKIESNEEFLEKIESNLDTVTQTVSKCISDIAIHDQNKKVIHSCFEEKLNKAILDTEQVATKLSEACNKAPALKFYVPDSRLDNIDKTLHDHDKEMQNLINK
eukprot:10652833-Ditylum_brightwellii.AAC.1